ncbi:DUF2510 domain-containing protein [Micropruina sp.]|uniref:DUF2510 domain-containing protein n=1 Tax=Micropruina sp. TaxID=2737536 RepID=UPI0039E69359
MAQPGWFPDPGGQAGMFRYWDGTAWTDQLSADPAAGSTPPGPNNRARVVVAAIAAIVVLALLAIFFLPRVFGGSSTPERPVPTGSPTVSAWDETTRPTPTPSTPTPTPTPTKSPEISLPCPAYDDAVVNGRLYGGALSVPVIDDSRWEVNAVRVLPWSICATGLERQIAPTWVSEVILAGIQPRSMLGTLHEQAGAIAEDSVERFYIGEKAEFKQISSTARTIDGLSAWELSYQVRIHRLKNIPGDNVYLLVVQHTDGSRSVLMTFATIGDTQTQKQVDASRDGLKVEKR